MTTRDFVPLTQYTELKNDFLKLNDRRNKLELENIKLKELLKECRKYIVRDVGYNPYTESAIIYQKINQALGEDK